MEQEELSWLTNGHLTCTWTCPWDSRDTQRHNGRILNRMEVKFPVRSGKGLEEGGFNFNDNVKSAASCRIPTIHGLGTHVQYYGNYEKLSFRLMINYHGLLFGIVLTSSI